jgi:WD40 repeat protein
MFHPTKPQFFTSDSDGLNIWSFDLTDGLLRIGPPRQLLPPRFGGQISMDREGELLAVAGRKTVALLDTRDPPGRARLLDFAGEVVSVSLSPDGRWAAVGSAGTFGAGGASEPGFGLIVLNARTGKVEKELIKSRVLPASGFFSPDGRWLLTATFNEFGIWEPGTWRPVRQIPREPDNTVVDIAAAAAFAPDGKVVALATSETAVRLLDTDTWLPLSLLQGPDAFHFRRLWFAADGAQLMVSSTLSTRVWDLRRIRAQLTEAGLDWEVPAYPPALPSGDGKPLRVEVDPGMVGRPFFQPCGGKVRWVGFSPDGRLAFSASDDKTLRAWGLPVGFTLRPFIGHTAEVYGAALSADGRRLLSYGKDGTVRLWEVETGKELHRLDRAGGVTSVAFAPDNRHALIGAQEGLTRLWDVESWKELCQLKSPRGVCSVAVSSDGRHALIAGGTEEANNHPTLQLWDLKTAKNLDRFADASKIPGVIRKAVFSPDDGRILSAGSDGCLRLWDVATGKEVRCFRGHSQAVTSMAFSPDGRRALSCGGDATVRLWDVATGRELACHAYDNESPPVAVAFSPDGRHALIGPGHDPSRMYTGVMRLVHLPTVEKAPPQSKKQ